MELALVLVVLGGLVATALVAGKSSKNRQLARAEAEVEPVKRLAEEDVTALGVELQDLDIDLAGTPLGRARTPTTSARSTPTSRPRWPPPADPTRRRPPRHRDPRGRPLRDGVRPGPRGRPAAAHRRPPCFFDPRHGMSVADVPYTPPGGALRDVPACELDVERVSAGAEPDIRKVMVGSRRVPYWQGGRAYQPYAQGYFGGFGPMDWMFMGMLFSGGFDGLGEGIGAIGEGIGDMFGGIGDGIGNMFDGFDGSTSSGRRPDRLPGGERPALHVTRLGDTGPVVAFCHGLFGQGKNWTQIAKDLSRDHRVLLVDMPNHGRSPWTEHVRLPRPGRPGGRDAARRGAAGAGRALDGRQDRHGARAAAPRAGRAARGGRRLADGVLLGS